MSIHTFLPVHVLRDLGKRNPNKPDFKKSLDWALRLRRRRHRVIGKLPNFVHGIVNPRVDTGTAEVRHEMTHGFTEDVVFLDGLEQFSSSLSWTPPGRARTADAA